jgi:hypothetical protein
MLYNYFNAEKTHKPKLSHTTDSLLLLVVESETDETEVSVSPSLGNRRWDVRMEV